MVFAVTATGAGRFTVCHPEADSPANVRWESIYVDSPETLATKLALARERGLAGSGFWAIGYERGLPAYTALIKKFHAGKLAD